MATSPRLGHSARKNTEGVHHTLRIKIGHEVTLMLSDIPRPSFVQADGSKYTGDFQLQDGVVVRQGSGAYVQPDGTAYHGEWRLDRMHGYGTCVGLRVCCIF